MGDGPIYPDKRTKIKSAIQSNISGNVGLNFFTYVQGFNPTLIAK